MVQLSRDGRSTQGTELRLNSRLIAAQASEVQRRHSYGAGFSSELAFRDRCNPTKSRCVPFHGDRTERSTVPQEELRASGFNQPFQLVGHKRWVFFERWTLGMSRKGYATKENPR